MRLWSDETHVWEKMESDQARRSIELAADFVGDQAQFLQDGMKTLVQLYDRDEAIPDDPLPPTFGAAPDTPAGGDELHAEIASVRAPRTPSRLSQKPASNRVPNVHSETPRK